LFGLEPADLHRTVGTGEGASHGKDRVSARLGRVGEISDWGGRVPKEAAWNK
jgi:hypothetical protein